MENQNNTKKNQKQNNISYVFWISFTSENRKNPFKLLEESLALSFLLS